MKRIQSMSAIATLAIVGLAGSAAAQLDGRAQNLTLPTASPGASVTQEVGLSEITIRWHRPGVKGRELWGTNLVPYDGTPTLWRVGANENTTVTVTHDCTVNGQALPAGTYGLHALPTAGDWTLIFSKNATSWGSYFYNPDEDALRVKVTPVENAHVEWLRFGFDDLSAEGCTAYLAWGDKKVPFEIGFDAHAIALASIRDQLRSVPAFTWQGWYQAAKYCFDQGIAEDEAMTWIDQSLERGENYMNLSLKGQMLLKRGDTEDGRALLDRALELAPAHRKTFVQSIIDAL